MIDLLLTILYAGLLILAIVLVYGVVVIAALCVRSGLSGAVRYREMQARHDTMRERVEKATKR